MGRVSALLRWDMHSHNFVNNYALLDSAFFVHVFHNKNRFTNFKKATRDQSLLCGTDTIAIKGWGEISLSLRIRD